MSTYRKVSYGILFSILLFFHSSNEIKAIMELIGGGLRPAVVFLLLSLSSQLFIVTQLLSNATQVGICPSTVKVGGFCTNENKSFKLVVEDELESLMNAG